MLLSSASSHIFLFRAHCGRPCSESTFGADRPAGARAARPTQNPVGRKRQIKIDRPIISLTDGPLQFNESRYRPRRRRKGKKGKEGGAATERSSSLQGPTVSAGDTARAPVGVGTEEEEEKAWLKCARGNKVFNGTGLKFERRGRDFACH